MILLPLAKEILYGYDNIPLKIDDLVTFCEGLKAKYGFKEFDLSLLKGDDLWYIHQLELTDQALK